MNISPRWIALAAVLSLSASASAQSGAAFGVIPAGVAVPAQLKTASQQPAGVPKPVGEPVEKALWARIIDRVLGLGAYEPSEGDTPASFSVGQRSRNPRDEFQALGVQVYGDLKGNAFTTILVEFTAIKETATAAGVREESWSYVADRVGRLLAVDHQVAVKGPNGELSIERRERLDPADPEVAARYARIVNICGN